MENITVRETVGSAYRVVVDFAGPDVTLNEQGAIALAATIPGARVEQSRFLWLKAATKNYSTAPRVWYCYRISETPNQGPLITTDQSLYEFWLNWSSTLAVMTSEETAWCK